ncbi:hypothetical protein QF046_002750 [Microbacterium sp. W4I4]|nr:hypothetical protein [Microbacterium sp. W4I4]
MSRSVASTDPRRAMPDADSSGRLSGVAGRGPAVAAERLQRVEVLADHLGDEGVPVEVAGEVLALVPSVAQHREAVADRVDLVEEVRDEEDGDALIAQRAHHGEQALDLCGVQAGGRLVEDEHLRLDGHRAADRDELLQGDGEGGEGLVGVEALEAEPGERVGGGAVGGPPVDAEEASDLVSEHHVLTDGEIRGEVDLLVDRRDAGLLRIARAREAAFPADDRDRSGVDPVYPGERLDERRLARAVLAHQRVDLAREQSEVDVVERFHAGELDGDPPHLHDGLFFGHRRLSRLACRNMSRVDAGRRDERRPAVDQYLRSGRAVLAASAESKARLGTMMYESTLSPSSAFFTTSRAVSPNSGLYSCT